MKDILSGIRSSLIFVRGGQTNINRREQEEHVCLYEGNEYVQTHENHRDHDFCEAQEYVGHLLARKHIAVKTDGKREGTDEQADELNNSHEPHNHYVREWMGKTHWAREMHEILYAVGLKARCIEVDEGDNGQT